MNQSLEPQALPPMLYRSEAFAEDLDLPAPVVARRSPFGRRSQRAVLMVVSAPVEGGTRSLVLPG